MPFQPINFAGIAPRQNSFLTNLVSNIAKGYQLGQMPAQMERQSEMEQLRNAFQKLKNEQEPQRFSQESQSRNISNAMNQLLLNQQPEKFRSEMSSRSASNALRGLQRQQLEMELDPSRKAEFINSLANAFGGDNNLKNSLIRKSLGLSEMSPQDAIERQLDIYKRKQQLKNSGEVPTTATITANQKVSSAIENVLPLIGELEGLEKGGNVPGQFVGRYFNPDEQANYEAKVGTIVDALVGALGLPKIEKSIGIVEKIVGKRPFESDKAYEKRLANLKTELGQRKARATNYSQKSAAEDPLGIR